VDPLPVRKVSDAIDGDEVRVVNFRNERQALPLQHIPVLWGQPSGRTTGCCSAPRRGTTPRTPCSSCASAGEGRCLGDELAGAGAVETPAVVYALEAPLVIDSALGEQRQAVRAGIVEDAPLAGATVVLWSMMLSPNTVLPCGMCGSRSHTSASGYHWSSQSNRSSSDGDGCCSSVRGVSVAMEDTDSRAARRHRRLRTGRVPPLMLSLAETNGMVVAARGSGGREGAARGRGDPSCDGGRRQKPGTCLAV
jgi:hypothetical protein